MNKKHFLNLLIILFSLNNIYAQVSEQDLKKLNKSQIDALRKAVQSKELQIKNNDITDDNIINEEAEAINSKIVNFESPIEERSEFFGYDYFQRDISFFDNIPTPLDFKLGPGDEVILSLWGETNLRERFTINKDGMIYYSNIGFINLSNKNLIEAKELLLEELSNIYSTLKSKNNSTKLMLELGQLKSINVYFSGNIKNPGINLIHPFSDIFSAIVQSGGIDENGSLREVELIRNGETFTTVDFYSFFMDGKNVFSNIKLIDGDVIHIPDFKNRVNITGEVNRPHYYELLSNESISDLIRYASGFTSNASSNLILNQVIPIKERLSDDFAKSGTIVNYFNEKSINLNNGDSVYVPRIPEVDFNVFIYGRVKAPGSYPAKNSTLKKVLDIAGGFEDPIYRSTIQENNIKIMRSVSGQFYSQEFSMSYLESDKFQLMPNDKIFVYENQNFGNNYTFRVEGQVKNPGTYPFQKGITVREAILKAGGRTELASKENITVINEFESIDELGNETTIQKNLVNVNLDYEIQHNTLIRVPLFENVVEVNGNVYDPGLIAFKKGLTLQDAIKQAGGYKTESLKNRVYVVRGSGEVIKIGILGGRFQKLKSGDSVFVPVNPNPSEKFNVTSFISDLTSVLANLAAIIVIIDNNSN